MTETIKVYTFDNRWEPLKFWDNYTDHFMNDFINDYNQDYVMLGDKWWAMIKQDLMQYGCTLHSVPIEKFEKKQHLEFENKQGYTEFMLRWG